MPMTLAQIEREVKLLSPKEQVVLCTHLQERLAPPVNELDKVWGKEARKRIQSYQSGKSKGYSADKVISDLKAELAARHK